MQPLFCCKPKTLGRCAVAPLMIALVANVGIAQKVQAQGPPPSAPRIKNYLGMSPGETQYIVGGEGTSAGTMGTSWGNNIAAVPPLDNIPLMARSSLEERILLWKRFHSGSFQPSGSTSTPIESVTGTASTSGHFKILALRYSNADGTRPTGKMGLLVRLSAQANSFAGSLSGGFPTPHSTLPQGTSHKASLQVRAGKNSETGANPNLSQPSSSVQVESKQLLTLNWDDASLCEGEDNIYALEVDAQSVEATATTTSEGVYAYSGVSAAANAQTDTRSLTLSRAGAVGERVINGATHGDTTYSYMRPAPLIRPYDSPDQVLEENWQWIRPVYGGTWQSYHSVENLESYGTSHSWTPPSTDNFHTESSTGSRQLMPTGQLSLNSNGNWTGNASTPSPTEQAITYEVTDTDGATAQAQYVFHVHEPVEWEKPAYFTDPDTYWHSVSPVQVHRAEAGLTSSVEADFLFDSYYFDATKEAVKQGSTALSVIIAGAQPGLAVPAALLGQAVGVAVDEYAQTPALNQDGSFDACWNLDLNNSAANCTWEGGRPTVGPNGAYDNSDETKRLYTLTDPVLVVEHRVKGYKGATYNENGKSGDLDQFVGVTTGSKHVVGTFKLNDEGNPDLPMGALHQGTSPTAPSGGSS